jgi:antitoxin component of RelBE/YafQ-DinJ toxin-antitoxin module
VEDLAQNRRRDARERGVTYSRGDWAIVAGPGLVIMRPVETCMTICHTACMAKAISVRLDDDAERALRTLEASGLTRSEAIRTSLLASADRLRRRKTLAAEAAALEADAADREEMVAVAELMEALRAPR